MKYKFIFLFFIVLMLSNSCKKNSTDSKTSYSTISFINKTDESITITDNSGKGVFIEFKVLPYSTKEITYECPEVGSCNIDWYYTYSGSMFIHWRICICNEGTDYGEKYTFGYCPDSYADEEERCQSCNNPSACD